MSNYRQDWNAGQQQQPPPQGTYQQPPPEQYPPQYGQPQYYQQPPPPRPRAAPVPPANNKLLPIVAVAVIAIVLLAAIVGFMMFTGGGSGGASDPEGAFRDFVGAYNDREVDGIVDCDVAKFLDADDKDELKNDLEDELFFDDDVVKSKVKSVNEKSLSDMTSFERDNAESMVDDIEDDFDVEIQDWAILEYWITNTYEDGEETDVTGDWIVVKIDDAWYNTFGYSYFTGSDNGNPVIVEYGLTGEWTVSGGEISMEMAVNNETAMSESMTIPADPNTIIDFDDPSTMGETTFTDLGNGRFTIESYEMMGSDFGTIEGTYTIVGDTLTIEMSGSGSYMEYSDYYEIEFDYTVHFTRA